MKEFMGKDFLLNSPLAEKLYHEHAAKMPIFDFHCHLVPEQIAHDYKFRSVTECWIGANGYGDHYKWRLLREMGIPEKYITGDASDWEKFEKYAECMPYFVGNPIYEWTHLELQRFFNIYEPLCPENAKKIYDSCNKTLETLTARKMMELSNVDTVFTTDDPVDDLHFHDEIKADKSFKINVAPAWRPDKILNVERPEFFIKEAKTLGEITGKDVSSLKGMLEALDERLDFFVSKGCVASDHALDVVHYAPATYEEADAVYRKGLAGEKISFEEEDIYKGYLMMHLGRAYHSHGMVMELHIGALRNNSKRMFGILGADTGFDATEDREIAEKLSALLNALDDEDKLPKTVLFTLNEKDYVVLATLKNCFQGGMKGKIQMGTAWWFNDCYDGMLTQMQRLANDGLISCFIGMLTDSRSFLSYPRHEYFRREMCDFLAELVNKGRYPNDEKTLGKIVEDICFNNAKAYFKK
ncbi:MAG: glucuronate isomerase [Bacillota bacterium]|nr:glucuronate isomerase [Bacillota bacterium]